MKTSPEILPLSDFADNLRRGLVKRSVLLIRHGQRPAIAPTDPTFGKNLPLTPEGKVSARAVGSILRGSGDFVFLASPMKRTRETARIIADAAGYPDTHVSDAAEIGVEGFFTQDINLTQSGYEKIGSAVATDMYLRDGMFPGYNPLRPAAEKTFGWLTETDFGAPNAVIASHDIFIAAIMHALGVRKFSSEYWVGFLQSAAMTMDSDGEWTLRYCVPDPKNWRSRFIQ